MIFLAPICLRSLIMTISSFSRMDSLQRIVFGLVDLRLSPLYVYVGVYWERDLPLLTQRFTVLLAIPKDLAVLDTDLVCLNERMISLISTRFIHSLPECSKCHGTLRPVLDNAL